MRSPTPSARCRTARSCRTESSRGSPDIRTRSARPARSARTTGTRSSCPAIASSPPKGSARTAASASTTSGGCWSSKVSLSEDLRNELAAIAPRSDCDRLAELSGLFHTAGSVHLRGRGEVAVHLDVAGSAVARRAFTLLRGFGVTSEIRTYRQRAFARATRYQLHVAGGDHALQVLYEAGVLTQRLAPLEHPPRRVVARACCRIAYLRGALLGGGSLSGPRAPHLELRSASLTGAHFVAEVAARQGAELAVLDRVRHAVAYAKGAEAIADVLVATGASDAVLAFQESAVMGATRARANRLANADHANLVRASRAAHAQLRAVERLRRRGELAKLPPPLQEIAELRVRHPTLSLRELALKCRPPATKAAAHRRLRKLQMLAEP
ncbi:MAG: DNA-binding protein WhiA [Actinobacteria bacterium]|nr:MAG: DNA-binding protein WhiA [Actinomycetota bacterium]